MKKFFKHIFNRKAEPAPDMGLWNIPGGKNGKQLMRAPIDTWFGGSEDAETPAQEREVERKFHQAVHILSQSRTGRYLLQSAIKHGYMVVVDDAQCEEGQVYGLCDPIDKTITMICKEADNVAEMVVILAHELTHAMQFSTTQPAPGEEYSLYDDILICWAREADAVAHELQVACELAMGDPNGPVNQYKNDDCLKNLMQGGKYSAKSVLQAMELITDNPENLDNGSILALGFEYFYTDHNLKKSYEFGVMGFYNAKMQSNDNKPKNLWTRLKNAVDTYRLDRELKPAFNMVAHKEFTKEISSKDLRESQKHMGQSYLDKHLPDLNLRDVEHGAVSAKTRNKMVKFYEGRAGYDGLKEQAKALPTYKNVSKSRKINLSNCDLQLKR